MCANVQGPIPIFAWGPQFTKSAPGFMLSIQETNQWATGCSLSLHDGPWQFFLIFFYLSQWGLVCPITNPALVVGCSCFCVVLIFYNSHSFFYIFYPIYKRIFHLGGLVSKMHISVYMLLTEWKCFCFSSFTEYKLGIMNIQCIL